MSEFTAHLGVQMLQDARGRAILREGRVQWIVTEPLRYRVGAEDSDEVIEVPAGFVTDFASIPRALWAVEPPAGQALKAAVIHDYLYARHGVISPPGSEPMLARYSRADADAIFSEAMAALGVPAWKRAILYAGVRAGGWIGWGR